MSMTILTGVIYPAVVTGVSQWWMPQRANGSLVERQGVVVGSDWIGQSFARPDYFWGRLSATSPEPYNAAASSGSNYGPMHPGLLEAAKQRIQELKRYRSDDALVPIDLVTSSASGLDPHISPAAAEYQIERVAKQRGIPEEEIRQVVQKHTEGRQFGVLGELRVNVLRLNLELDEISKKHSQEGLSTP